MKTPSQIGPYPSGLRIEHDPHAAPPQLTKVENTLALELLRD